MKKVKIYTTSTCTYCKMAKDFFTENKVEYEEYNVGTDAEKRAEMLEMSGQMGVPVIMVEGEEDPIIGFDRARLIKAIGIEEKA